MKEIGRWGRIIYSFILSFIMLIAYNNCAPFSSTSGDGQSRPSFMTDQEIEEIFLGRELFEKNCMGCHGTIESTNLRNRTPQQIVFAMDTIEAMRSSPALQTLKDQPEKIAAISAALSFEGPIACANVASKRTQLHRLTRREVRNTLRDLLGVTTINPEELPLDGENSNGFDNDSSSVSLSTLDIDKIYDVMNKAVAEAFANGVPQSLSCQANESPVCSEDILRNMLYKAFRRQPTDDELASYKLLAAKETDFTKGLMVATLRALLSPHFYFLVIDDSQSTEQGVHKLTNFEIASRLSFLLWSSMPDENLLTAAAQNKLNDSVVLKQQIERMLNDPKAGEFVDHFFGRWLSFGNIDGLNRDMRDFPQFAELKGDMKQETRTFISQLIGRNGDISDIFYGKYTYLNRRLSGFYGVPSAAGSDSEFVKTSLAGTPRMGVLTQPGVIAAINGNNDSSKPIHRGIVIYEKFFCGSFGEPPPVSDDIVKEIESLTVKQGLQTIRNNPNCATCHNRINPIGLAFENFDSIGQFRTEYDNGLPVEAFDTLADGRQANGALELIQKMGEGHKLEKCFARFVASYSVTRLLQSSESCQVDNILYGKGTQPMSMVELIEKISTHKIFNEQALDER